MTTMTNNAATGSTDTTPAWHVTGNAPSTVAIVACGPTGMDWLAGNFLYDPPWSVDEVWSLNKGLRTFRCDAGFVMDDMVGESRRSDQYRRDLNGLTVPIITSIVDDQVKQLFPSLKLFAYPVSQVFWALGAAIHKARGNLAPTPEQVRVSGMSAGHYIHNSIPYMLAYAYFIGCKRVLLFGADYTFPGSPAREDDRANAEYWVGLLRGLGVDVAVPETTTLLSTRDRKGMYGFGARQPLISTPSEAELAQILARVR